MRNIESIIKAQEFESFSAHNVRLLNGVFGKDLTKEIGIE